MIGWIFSQGEEHAIYNLLIELVNNRTLIKEKEQAASIRAKNFDWKNVTNQILDFYEEVEGRCKVEKN